MPQGKATPKPQALTPVDYFWINTQADILPAMNGLSKINWKSRLENDKDATTGVWSYAFSTWPIDNPEGIEPIPATFGDVFVWTGTQLLKMRYEVFQTNYTVTS